MSKGRTEPKYVGLPVRGPEGLYFRFPDLPGLSVADQSSLGLEGYLDMLQQLQDHLDELRAHGLPVPEPTPIREVMANPVNRQGHRIFDLGELMTIKRNLVHLAELRQALDEQDALVIRRYITVFGEDDEFVGEIDFDLQPGLHLLKDIFGPSPNDPFLTACYPIGEQEARTLALFLKSSLQMDRHAYFLEAHDRHGGAPTQET